MGLAAEARVARALADRLGARIEIGGGQTAGAHAAALRLSALGAGALISFGLAGGLDPTLAAGALIVPETVLLDGTRIPTDWALRQLLGGGTGHVLLAGETVMASADQKRRAFAHTGAAAIDLETAGVIRAGLPFAVLRAVCDPAGRDLPPAALLALDSAGAIGIGRVLASVFADPGQMAELIGLGRDAARARRALSRFGR